MRRAFNSQAQALGNIFCTFLTGIPHDDQIFISTAVACQEICIPDFLAQNYSNHMFQMRINEGAPLVDPAGWTEPGNIPTGSWFYMVQTNPSMARLRVGPAGSCVDDVTVRLALPQTFGNGFAGAVFLMR